MFDILYTRHRVNIVGKQVISGGRLGLAVRFAYLLHLLEVQCGFKCRVLNTCILASSQGLGTRVRTQYSVLIKPAQQVDGFSLWVDKREV